MHCYWCQRFIAKDTQPTYWESLHRGEWVLHEKLLCPECSASTQVNLSYWRPANKPTVSEEDHG